MVQEDNMTKNDRIKREINELEKSGTSKNQTMARALRNFWFLKTKNEKANDYYNYLATM